MSDPSPAPGLPPELVQILRCPRCQGELGLTASSFDCPACQLSYPVVAGVPQFSAEAATPLPPAEAPEPQPTR